MHYLSRPVDSASVYDVKNVFIDGFGFGFASRCALDIFGPPLLS